MTGGSGRNRSRLTQTQARRRGSVPVPNGEGEAASRGVTPPQAGRNDSARGEEESVVAEHEQRNEAAGNIMSTDQVMSLVRGFVKEHVFPGRKFHKERLGGLDYGGNMCRIIFGGMKWTNQDEEWKRRTWVEMKKVVKEVFKRRKNACHTTIKRATIGKWFGVHGNLSF